MRLSKSRIALERSNAGIGVLSALEEFIEVHYGVH